MRISKNGSHLEVCELLASQAPVAQHALHRLFHDALRDAHLQGKGKGNLLNGQFTLVYYLCLQGMGWYEVGERCLACP